MFSVVKETGFVIIDPDRPCWLTGGIRMSALAQKTHYMYTHQLTTRRYFIEKLLNTRLYPKIVSKSFIE